MTGQYDNIYCERKHPKKQQLITSCAICKGPQRSEIASIILEDSHYSKYTSVTVFIFIYIQKSLKGFS